MAIQKPMPSLLYGSKFVSCLLQSPVDNPCAIELLLPPCACITFDIFLLKAEFHDLGGSCPHCPMPF